MLSSRIKRFHALVRQANEQPTEWLVSVLKDKQGKNGYFTPLARLACLRILACRNPSGRDYPSRKKEVRAALGV